ncbi:MAG: sodium:proton antiporter [Bacillota bacterium]
MLNNLVFASIFTLGMYTMVAKNNLIKMVIGMSLMEASIFFWVIVNSNSGREIPIHYLGNISHNFNDPVPQALTLTGIVIGASTTALILTLIIELNKFTHCIEKDKIKGLND